MNKNVKLLHADILFAEVRQQLKEGNKAKVRVSGMSMWPFLCHGRDFVILKAVTSDQVKIGDIVLLQKPDGSYLLHRVTNIKENQIQTTGDHLIYRDGWFSRDSIIGMADSIVRKEKEISCGNPWWKSVMGIWRICFPIRGILVSVLYRISKFRHQYHI